MSRLLSYAGIRKNCLIRYAVVSLIFSIHNIVECCFCLFPGIAHCYLTMQVPFWISQFFADGFGVPIPARELFWSLIFTLLIPLVLGKVPSLPLFQVILPVV